MSSDPSAFFADAARFNFYIRGPKGEVLNYRVPHAVAAAVVLDGTLELDDSRGRRWVARPRSIVKDRARVMFPVSREEILADAPNWDFWRMPDADIARRGAHVWTLQHLQEEVPYRVAGELVRMPVGTVYHDLFSRCRWRITLRDPEVSDPVRVFDPVEPPKNRAITTEAAQEIRAGTPVASGPDVLRDLMARMKAAGFSAAELSAAVEAAFSEGTKE